MYKTRIDIPAENRSRLIRLLNQQLASGIDLMMQCKQAHWNVKGPQFIALHELFDRIAGELTGYVDLMAERITALGGIAEGTVKIAAQKSELAEYPLEISEGQAHIEALAASLAAFGGSVRNAIAAANDQCDIDTADVFTQISRGIDKSLWFVEAHLQA